MTIRQLLTQITGKVITNAFLACFLCPQGALAADPSPTSIFIDFEDLPASYSVPITNSQGTVVGYQLHYCHNSDPYASGLGIGFFSSNICDVNFQIPGGYPIFDPMSVTGASGYGIYGQGMSMSFNTTSNPNLQFVTKVTFTATSWFRNWARVITNPDGSQDYSNTHDYSFLTASAIGGNTVTIPRANQAHVALTGNPGQFIRGVNVSISPANPGEDNAIGVLTMDNITITIGTPSGYSLSLSTLNSAILPNKTPGNTSTMVIAKLSSTDPGALEGKVIQFTSQAVERSGGHDHSGGRPTGSFSSYSCTTDSSGHCTIPITYFASEVGGTEKLTAILASDSAVKATTDLTIKVPNLFQVATDGDSNFRLTGTASVQGQRHLSNHFLAAKAMEGIFGVTRDFYGEYSAKLGLNDMSLPNGGLFDINGSWSQAPVGHISHRKGTSVDIDKCALSTVEVSDDDQVTCDSGWIDVSERIDYYCKKNGGRLVQENTIHCEFRN